MPCYVYLPTVLCSICFLFTNANGISNTNFNANIRDYSTNQEIRNLSDVKTLQKEDKQRHANFVPVGLSETFKEIPDNVLSSSSHSRGLLHQEVPGYVIGDYEEIPHYGHGYDYHSHDVHHEPHDYKQYYAHHDSGHYPYSGHHHLDYGHHYKNHNHALAAKTLLWPIAGIALLGAAAALVNNPVLLQLGVVSGRRKRNTEEISTDHTPNLKIWTRNYNVVNNGDEQAKDEFKKRMLVWNAFKKIKHGVPRNTNLQTTTQNFKIVPNLNINDNDDRFIPIPLKFKNE